MPIEPEAEVNNQEATKEKALVKEERDNIVQDNLEFQKENGQVQPVTMVSKSEAISPAPERNMMIMSPKNTDSTAKYTGRDD